MRPLHTQALLERLELILLIRECSEGWLMERRFSERILEVVETLSFDDGFAVHIAQTVYWSTVKVFCHVLG